MSRRLALSAAALSAAGLVATTGSAAHAGPKCNGTTATAVHTVEERAEPVPVAGPVVARVVHGPVEDAACRLP